MGFDFTVRLIPAYSRMGGLLAYRQTYPARDVYLLLIAPLVAFPISALGGWPERGTDQIARLHKGPGIANHPVDVTPSRSVSIPPGWPLGVDGTIVCTTCHSSLPRLDVQGEAMLRGESGSSEDSRPYCTNCHREDGPRTAVGMHWAAMSKAHIMKHDDNKATAIIGGAMDGESRMCLSCHDGVSAADAGYESSGDRARGFLGDKARNHPIGVRYPPGGTRGVEVRLRPASLLPKSISLPGGYVGCNSCHDLYGSNASLLTIPIEGSKLCLTCHDME